MFDEIIERMQNRKHYLLIFAILSTVLAGLNGSILGLVFGILGIIGAQDDNKSYINAFSIFCTIELVLYIVVIFIGTIIFISSLFQSETNGQIAFVVVMLIFIFIYSTAFIVFKSFCITLAKRCLKDYEEQSQECGDKVSGQPTQCVVNTNQVNVNASNQINNLYE